MKMLGAVVQMTSGADVAANLRRAGELVAEAAARGAKLAVLPENFAFLGEHERDKFPVAEPVSRTGPDGPILAAMREIARRNHIALVLGGLPEKAAQDTHVHNTAVYLDDAGEVRAIYRKIHLFDVVTSDGIAYNESGTVAAGDEPVAVETPWGGLGLSVCYDVRFPELYRALGLKGVRIVTVPAAFTLLTGKDHWHVL